jgi:hypothetical protein
MTDDLPLPEPDFSLDGGDQPCYTADQMRAYGDAREAAARERAAKVPPKLWLWKNFVDGRPEYWAFDNPFPINMDDGDPQTLGEPCGYALFKPSRPGRSDISDDEVLRRIATAIRGS